VLMFVATAVSAQEFTRDEIVLRLCGKQYYAAVINEVVDDDTFKASFIGADVPEACLNLNEYVRNSPWYKFWAQPEIRKMLSTRSYLYRTPLGEHHFHLGETVKVKCSGFDYTEGLVVDLTDDGFIAFDFEYTEIQERCGNVYA